MDENIITTYCTILLIDDDNHSKIFISEKNNFYSNDEDKIINMDIINRFKDIRKSYYDINVIDITDNHYKYDKSNTKKYCTLLLIDDDHSKIIISEKK